MSAELVCLATVAVTIAIGAMSPGPSFVVVARTAMAAAPRSGRMAAFGVGAGGLLLASAAAAGLGAVVGFARPLLVVVKIAGGAYLVFLAVRLFRPRRETGIASGDPIASSSAFSTALLTQICNPKAIVVYGSVFAATLPAHPPVWLLAAIPLTVAAVEIGWFLTVAAMMSRPAPRRAYARAATAVDCCAGAVMGGLGTAFMVDGMRVLLM